MKKVKDFKKTIDKILEIDPDATLEYQDCGSGTNVINIGIAESIAKEFTHKELDTLEREYSIYSNDEEGYTVLERLTFENHTGFFLLLS